MPDLILPFSQQLADSLYNSADPFPVDFNKAWVWLGYSSKGAAKRGFIGYGFVESMDFRLCSITQSAPKGGLTHREDISLTVDCFKTWGMMANTPQGKQVRVYFLECERIAKASQSQQHPTTVYADRLLNHSDHIIPFGYWSVFHESAWVLLHIENVLKIKVEKYDTADISIGLGWAAFRKDKEWALPFVFYNHYYRDTRKTQRPKAYAMAELPYFKQWLTDVYQPIHLPEYLEYKRKQKIKEQKKLM